MAKNYHKYNIHLEEAMTIPLTQSVRVWDISGLHIEAEDIPKNANVKKTFVMKLREGKIRLGVEWTVEGELGSSMPLIAEFSALEELKDKFPKLFELEGSLYAFS